jgi:hypothetical protein
MAKFKVNEQCAYKGNLLPKPRDGVSALAVGQRVTVSRVLSSDELKANCFWAQVLPGTWYYLLQEDPTNYYAEELLEKLSPKHQDADLKAADPLFIQSQLPRLLGKEKVREAEKS